MSNPENGAARNTMSDFERQFYALGFEDAKERIIKLLEEDGERNYISQETFDYVVSIIKGEQNPPVRAEKCQKDNETVVFLTESACSCGCKGENK